MSPVEVLAALLLAAAPCPPGSTSKGGEPPKALHGWCEDKAGKKHGPETEWYAAGRKKSEGAWLHGVMEGAWRAWREDGTLWMDERFVRGEPASTPQAAPPRAAGGSGVVPSGRGAAAPAGSPVGGSAGLLDPGKHPRAAELRSYVGSLTDCDRREAKEATLALIVQLERLNKSSGGTSERRTEGEREILVSHRPTFASRFLVDLETQLMVSWVADRATHSCLESVSYPDPEKKQQKLLEEKREIDCALLASDPDLGAMARDEAEKPLPWTLAPSGHGPAVVARLSAVPGVGDVDIAKLQASSGGELRYGAVRVRLSSHGGYGGFVNSVSFITDTKSGPCSVLLEQLKAELGPPDAAPPGKDYKLQWKVGEREVKWFPTESFTHPSDRANGRCDVQVFLRLSLK